MTRKLVTAAFVFFALINQVHANEISVLKQKIESIIASQNATVGIAISDAKFVETLNINGDERFPMQSVFKFPIALAVLAEVDKGTLSLEQKIEIRESELLPGLWSPIREKYPLGASLSLAEIIKYTVSLSDNVGCDVLLRLLGQPKDVEEYFSGLGFSNIKIKINEEIMQSNWDTQFLNWTTPNEANSILRAFLENRDQLLSPHSHEFIWDIMKNTSTGKNRLRGQLPTGAIVAHKTGWSGKHKLTGVTEAVNNIGVIFLPNGEPLFVSVFVTNSTEDFQTNEKIISDIAKAAWDYFSEK